MLTLLGIASAACSRAPAKSAADFLIELDATHQRGTAEQALALYGASDPYWRWRFGLYLDPGPEQAHQAFLERPLPAFVRGGRAEVQILWDRAAELPDQRLRLLGDARRAAEGLHDEALIAKTDYRIAQVWLDANTHMAEAGQILETVVARARKLTEVEPLLLPRALVNLSVARMRLDRHDEAIALCNEAAPLLEFRPVEITMAHLENNRGWSLLQLGKGEEAMTHLSRSVDLFSVFDQRRVAAVLSNQASYYVRQHNLPRAQAILKEAQKAAESMGADQQAQVLADQAEVAAIGGDVGTAGEAIQKARRLSGFESKVRSPDDAHILFVESMLAELGHDTAKADQGFARVATSDVAWSFMRLEAARHRARSQAAAGHTAEAERQFNEAESMLQTMRGQLKKDESKLSFFEDSTAFYDEYVDLLVSQGNTVKALQVADRSRARLLSDYQVEQKGLMPLDMKVLSGRLSKVDGIALFYWLGDQRAYVWMVGKGIFECVPLGDPAVIRKLAKQYAKDTAMSAGMPPSARETGTRLRDAMLGPVRSKLTPDRRVFVMLDDELGLINPESLPGFHSDWLIEEAILSVVPSLAMLQSEPAVSTASKTLLAIGDANGTPEFPKLANARVELDKIAQLYPVERRDEIRQDQARPSAYRNANPLRYEMIHFTAHGKAEANNPLDSAVILSEEPDTKAYKLYARDVVNVPIQARLVTISACQSAASRTYRGEGVVGLAWAFLRAGAGQVVAGLWNVDDEVSQELMVRFYKGMRDHHKPAAVALRDAKREVMAGFKNPYYWAPFEIFAGYIEP